jgi:hypothetical protein
VPSYPIGYFNVFDEVREGFPIFRGGRDGLLSVGILAKIGSLYNSPAIPHEGAMENNTHLWDSRRFK